MNEFISQTKERLWSGAKSLVMLISVFILNRNSTGDIKKEKRRKKRNVDKKIKTAVTEEPMDVESSDEEQKETKR